MKTRRTKTPSSRPSSGADIEALYAAVFPGDPAALKRLLAAGADPNARRPGAEDTVLEVAAGNRLSPDLTLLLLKAGAKVTPRAVCKAAKSGTVPALAALLKAGGNPNAQAMFHKGRVPVAALNLIEGDEPTRRKKLDLLLKAGANVNRTDGGSEPLASQLIHDRALADRVFPLAGPAARKRILDDAVGSRQTNESQREHLLFVARLFLGAAGLRRRRKELEAAIDDHFAQKPGAAARLRKLISK